MDLLNSLTPTSQSILVISLVATTGLALGSLKFRGIGLGSAGALFTGIAFAHYGVVIEPEILHFAKEFGLILFVFTIGIQLGPSIIDLWRHQGVRLNALAILIVLSGALLTVLMAFLLNIQGEAAAGLFSGATTNTPSLGAAQQVLAEQSTDAEGSSSLLALGYAVAYPGGIVGIIASILLLKRIFNIDLEAEKKQLIDQAPQAPPLERRNLLILNANLSGVPLGEIPGRQETHVMISRIWKKQEDVVHPAADETPVEVGDVILTVGTASELDRFQMIVGQVSDQNLMEARGDASWQRVIVTNKKILGDSLGELGLHQRYDVNATRLIRAGVEMVPNRATRLHFGDLLRIVGNTENLIQASRFLGNEPKELDHTQFIPFFVGLTVGVICGLIPISLPGLPVPVRLGLAGGPLLVAILFSLIGNLGTLVWYIPSNANHSIRELGIILFLVCVGLNAGGNFMETVLTSTGAIWLLAGIVITMVPLLITGLVARYWLRLNFLTLSGVIAGSMTDPPALAFASSLCQAEGASIAYAAVYPLAMMLRILVAQILVLLLCG
ncbi:putative transporter [Rubinisphaera italica]|uniref:Aspartate/alanine antiporter n=1 Tax=Rubinisphaera italica TaxID=2527969 RepID=A0A5C5XII5_9PLAN|nr:putative transporter [Rubinisphaera italica]TWT62508.1 Aspartate/alanine antiporter [Rubinisphaera italica]